MLGGNTQRKEESAKLSSGKLRKEGEMNHGEVGQLKRSLGVHSS